MTAPNLTYGADLRALVNNYGFTAVGQTTAVRGQRERVETGIGVQNARGHTLTVFKPGPAGYDLDAARRKLADLQAFYASPGQ